MKPEDKLRQKERYEQAKKAGESFFPFTLFKDGVAILVVFSAIIALALLVGGELEAVADPTDTSYNPRPEWYFLFLFELLKYFPGELEPVATVVIPGLAVGMLFLLPFLDRSPIRKPQRRPLGMGIGLLVVMGIAGLTYLGATGEQVNPGGATESEAVYEGRLLYEDFRCGFCHSIRGVGGVVGPDLTSVDPERVSEWLGAHVEDGPGAMPVPDLILLPEEVEALTAYLETLAGAGASPGALVFQDNCAVCHRFGKIGGGSGPDLTGIDERRDLASLTQFIEDPKATNADSAMPAYADILSTEQLEAVVRYLLGEEPEAGGGTPFLDRTEGAATGAALFEQNCSACHQFQGEGGSLGPDLTDAGGTHDSAYLQTFIADPTAADPQNTMMGFSDKLTEDEIKAIVRYLLGEEAPPGTATPTAEATPEMTATPAPPEGAPNGAALFEQNCSACHQFQGEGGSLGPDLTDAGQKHDSAFLETFTADPTAVNPQSTMMGFSDKLTEDEIKAIVRYLLGEEVPPSTAAPTPLPSDAQRGAELFQENCAVCHGFQGEPAQRKGSGSDLTGVTQRRDEEYIRGFIINPQDYKPGAKMKPTTRYLSNDEIDDIIAFILESSPSAADDALQGSEGGALYFQNCSGCHQFQGEGATIGPDLTDIGDRHDLAWLRQFIEEPPGVPLGTIMVGLKGILSDAEIEKIARFLIGEEAP